jgi:Flp pilus assembly secretin CpaC
MLAAMSFTQRPPKMVSRTSIAALAVMLGTILANPALAADGTDSMLRVYMNQARVLKLDRPVSKVIIGNAEVADATVADPKTIVLTGRAYGATNLVLLDADGNAIADERVIVSIDEGNSVRVFRQTQRSVFSCTPICEQDTVTKNAGTATGTP